jgi:hypothetical protein
MRAKPVKPVESIAAIGKSVIGRGAGLRFALGIGFFSYN